MKKRTLAFVIFASIILIPATFAYTSTNWDVTVTNGSLFCDSHSRSSIHGDDAPYALSAYSMSLHAIDSNSHLIHNISTDNVNIDSTTSLVASSASPNQNKVLLEESVRMKFINSEENNTICFSGYSESSVSAALIDFASSSIVDEASNISHSVDAVGVGNFRLASSSYKLAGTINHSFTVESTTTRVNIFDSKFNVSSAFQDPIDKLPLYVSTPSDWFCPFP
jgi:hypothetical protein